MTNEKVKWVLVSVAVLLSASMIAVLAIGSNGADNEDGAQGLPDEEERNYCTPDSRDADICIMLYDPVCGWQEDGSHGTYSNSCVACSEEKVLFWTEDECSQ